MGTSTPPPTGATSSLLVDAHVSRLSTLQTLLSKYGAPGSLGCQEPGDLQPVVLVPRQTDDSTPELVSSLSGTHQDFTRLHPFLYPIAKSQATGHFICAYCTLVPEQSGTTNNVRRQEPWPIVEAQLDGPGMRLLALNSEHLMRRIACECDGGEKQQQQHLVQLYNEGLGRGLLAEADLDSPYQPGSVAQLGYGVDKYVLLRVGPFPDLYERVSLQHLARGDEQSALIAAESANAKFTGFGSTFRFYSHLLRSLPQPRPDESRDAARMCLRLPLSTVGMTWEELRQVAVLGQVAEDDDSLQDAMDKVKALYVKIKEAEKDKNETDPTKSPEQVAIEEANQLIDMAVLDMRNWDDVRPALAKGLRAASFHDMANFIDHASVLQ